MNAAIAVVTAPFRAVYWLTHSFLRLFGHPFMLFPPARWPGCWPTT